MIEKSKIKVTILSNLKLLPNGGTYHYVLLMNQELNKFAKLSKTRRDHRSLIIEDHKSLMKVGPPQKKNVS